MKLNLVPARTGVLWVRLGLKNFRRQPLAFISLFFLSMTMISTVSLLPLVGNFLTIMLLPFATLSFVVAASVADESKDAPESPDGTRKPTGALMFLAAAQALRADWRPLVRLGMILAVYFVLTVLVTAVVDGGQLIRNYLLNEPLTVEMISSRSFLLANMLQMFLTLPLIPAAWQAPALLHWYRVGATKSIFFSLVAMYRNFGAYALFVLVWMGLLLLASIVASLIATVVIGVGSLGSDAGALAVGKVLMIGTAMVVAVMAQASNWFVFRDTFDPN